MKQLTPLGEYVLLREEKMNTNQGGVLIDESATGEKRYYVQATGGEVPFGPNSAKVGDTVFVQTIDLVPVMLSQKEKYFMTKYKNIIGVEIE